MILTAKPKKKSAVGSEIDLRNLWYAPHRRIQTATAAREAIEVAERITGYGMNDTPYDEQVLFVAMHTCAFRASRPVRGGGVRVRRAWLARWEAARSYIVEQNLGLVYSMIGRFGSRQLDEDDLLSEAMYALTRAVDRFNPWRGYKFSTYACNVIARALMRRGKHEGNHRRLFPVQHDILFERASNPDDGDGELYVERLRNVLGRNQGELTELETTILSHRFPSEHASRLTFQEIGDTIGLSKERVRQIQNVALTKLRQVLDADPALQ
ncbi:MAG TPA: sigma-70 family RNA polymerase sigma factor [Phycisphaerae bacterium]|nr:sigma-70 family RNA polymerase sigma factor [Phycisphaerae bacterium]